MLQPICTKNLSETNESSSLGDDDLVTSALDASYAPLVHAAIIKSMSESKTAISTTGAPAAIGPYSQAIRSGDLLFASGQVGFDPATGVLVDGDVLAQTERVLANIEAVLQAAGLGFADVVKTTVFLKSMGDFATMNAAYAKRFAPEGVTSPARSTIEVARLPKDALVEIEVVARFPQP